MTSSGPWSVKGIDPKAREIAKDLARRSGMTLGEWLNQMITDGTEAAPSDAFQDLEDRISSYPSKGYAEAQSDRERRPDRFRRNVEPLLSNNEASRISSALDALSSRMEAAEGRSGAAINHVDRAVRAALVRLDAGERDNGAMAQRVESALNLIRSEQRRTDDRMSRLEQEDASRISALRALETAVSRIRAPSTEEIAEAAAERLADRLASAEAQTREAVEKLEASLAGLDRRLTETEDRTSRTSDQTTAALDATERQLERLAEDLGAQVEATRQDMAEQLRRVVNSERIEVLEDAINQLASQVDQTEKSSAQAIDRMGREVQKIADGINERVAGVEQRNAGLADRICGEVGKMAEVMEKRLLRADYAHTEALQGLSAEISKVAERLTDRLVRNEGRTAEVLEEVNRQQRRFSEQAAQETGDIASELTDRIRKSEERTAKLLEEAQARIEARLGEAERRPSARLSPAGPSSANPAAQPAAFPQEATSGFGDFDDGGFLEPPVVDTPRSASARFNAFAADHAATTFKSHSSEPSGVMDAFGKTSGLGDPFEDDTFAADLEDTAEHNHALFGDTDRSIAGRRASLESLRAAVAEDPFEALVAPPPSTSLHNSPLGREHDDLLAAFDGEGFDADDDFFRPQEPAARRPGFGGAPAATTSDLFGSDNAFSPSGHAAGSGGFSDDDFGSGGFSDNSGFGASDAFESPMAPPVSEPGGFEIPAANPGKVSTRDLIARARSAARSAGVVEKPEKSKSGRASASEAETEKSGPFGLSLPKRKARKNNGVTAVTLVLATAVSLTVTAAVMGYVILNDQSKDEGRVGASIAEGDTPSAAPKTIDAAAPPAPNTTGELAVATAANPAAALPAPAATPNRATGDDPKLLYGAAVRQLEIKDPKGLATLNQSASLGYGPAAFHLSTLYDKGGSGVEKDPVKARQWAERAAKSGIPKAMYNLGLFLFDAKGGPPDQKQSAEWFRKAADLGLGDAQYNLARLYENGYGVGQNFSQAYMWYLIAAAGGDKDARSDAERLRPTLSNEARVAAERSANAFRPQTPSAEASAVASR